MIFVLYTAPINEFSGGSNVMMQMCELINTHTIHTAYVVPGHVRKGVDLDKNHFSKKLLDDLRKTSPGVVPHAILQNRDKFVAIYPEVVEGNPLDARRVVRWILLVPPKDVPPTWDLETDLILGFMPIYITLYNRLKLGPNLRCDATLFYAFLDHDYQDYGRERHGACCTTRKAWYFEKLGCGKVQLNHDPMNCFCFEPSYDLRPKDLETLHNACETFHSYDPLTFHILIAAMCGCTSIVHPLPCISLEEFHSQCGPLTKFGVAYGDSPDQVAHARATKHLVKDLVKQTVATNAHRTRQALDEILLMLD